MLNYIKRGSGARVLAQTPFHSLYFHHRIEIITLYHKMSMKTKRDSSFKGKLVVLLYCVSF